MPVSTRGVREVAVKEAWNSAAKLQHVSIVCCLLVVSENTLVFLFFQISHKACGNTIAHLSPFDSISYAPQLILIHSKSGNLKVAFLELGIFMHSQKATALGQFRSTCSVSSTFSSQLPHDGSMFMPLPASKLAVASLFWQLSHKNILILGCVSASHNHFHSFLSFRGS